MIRILVLLLFFGVDCAQAQGASEPRTGLVLAGGGARGIAHAGVIRALEEMRIPIHAVAGTSMGALVGGLYATGMDAGELQQVIWEMDWEWAFEDSVSRAQRPQRRKGDDYDYPSDINFSLKDGTLSTPLGIIQGQQVRQIIKELTSNVGSRMDFDELPIPYRAVATDIESGTAYVFGNGNIVTAMRASMSIPGLLTPVEHDGRLLVDGGLANNIPVDIARSMGVDRLIVVDIGTPLRSRGEITSMVAVADQMVGFLTRKNSEEQLATLQAQDLLLAPDLTGIGMLDFDQYEHIYQLGYDAARALAPQLAAFQVAPESWSDYLAARQLPEPALQVIDLIAVHNTSPLSDDMIRVRLGQQVGEPLDRERLLADIGDIYALGYWQIIDYDVRTEGDITVLHINAREKDWGDDKLKFGLNLVTDFDGANEFNLGTSYLWKGVNELGGEVYSRVQFGDSMILSSEFYQPLDLQSRWFVVPYLGYRDYDVFSIGPENDVTAIVGNWRVRKATADLAAGVNIARRSQLRLGLNRSFGEYRVDVSSSPDLPEEDFHEGALYVSYRYDGLDNVFFPTDGGLFYTEYEMQRGELGADVDFERWQALGQAAYSFGQDSSNTVILTGRTGQSLGATNEPQNYYQLGGLFNLSGLPQDLLSGRQMAFMMAQYQRRLSDNSVLPVDLPVYAGFSLEGGQLWRDRSDVEFRDLRFAGSVYLGVDSPIGPFHLALGATEGSNLALYLSLGWPFLTNQTRIGR